MYEQILITFSGIVDNWPTNRSLHFGDIPNSRETLNSYDPPRIKGLVLYLLLSFVELLQTQHKIVLFLFEAAIRACPFMSRSERTFFIHSPLVTLKEFTAVLAETYLFDGLRIATDSTGFFFLLLPLSLSRCVRPGAHVRKDI